MRTLLTILALLAFQTAAAEASEHSPARRPQVALTTLTGINTGTQIYSDWRKVRPPDKLKPDLDKLKPDPDKVTVKVEATHHHRRHHHHHRQVVVVQHRPVVHKSTVHHGQKRHHRRHHRGH